LKICVPFNLDIFVIPSECINLITATAFSGILIKGLLLAIVVQFSVDHDLKRDIWPKNKICHILPYSPSCGSKPVWIHFFCWTQKMIIWRMMVIKHLTVD